MNPILQGSRGRHDGDPDPNPEPPRLMTNPSLLSLALSNGHAETDAEISAALRDAGLSQTEADERARFAVSSLDELRDLRDGAGIMGVARTDDGRTVQSSRWTAEEIRSRHGFHLAGIPADDVRRCWNDVAEAEAFLRAVNPMR